MVERKAVPRGLVPITEVTIRGVLAKQPTLIRLAGGRSCCEALVEVDDETFVVSLREDAAVRAEQIEAGSGVQVDGKLQQVEWDLRRGDARENLVILGHEIVVLAPPFSDSQLVDEV